eukprot:2107691-Alexandrium_andersonii.AAC.1
MGLRNNEMRHMYKTSEAYTHASPAPALPLEMATRTPSLPFAFSRKAGSRLTLFNSPEAPGSRRHRRSSLGLGLRDPNAFRAK